MKLLSKKKKMLMLHTLKDFIEFAKWQESNDNIDGACDPAMSVDRAERLIKEFAPELLTEDQTVTEYV